MLADDGGAQDAAVLVDDDLDEAFGPAFGLGAVVFVIRPAQNVDRRRSALAPLASVRPTWASSGSV